MKRILSALMLLLTMQLSSLAQTKITVELPKDLVTQSQLRTFGDSLVKVLKGDAVTQPPVVKLKDCDCGPELKAITAVTQASLNMLFHGCNVTDIAYAIVQGSDTITTGNVVPQNNTPSINFKKTLQAGKYVLLIRGRSCYSNWSKDEFTVPKLSGAVVPPPAVIVPTDVVPLAITKGMPEHFNPRFTPTANGWLINDDATVMPADNYDFWYFINGQIVKLTQPLKDFPYSSNNPLRILKMQGRKNLDTFNRWIPQNLDDGYYSSSSGSAFSYNVSASFYTGVFQGVKTGFYNPIPAGYDPTKGYTQWADIVEPFTLPKDHILVIGRGEWPVDLMLKKGVTHISVFDFPTDGTSNVEQLRIQGKTYSGVQRPEHFLGLNPSGTDRWVNGYNLRYWPNGPLSKEEATNRSNGIQIHALTINETEEGSSFMPKDQQMWNDIYNPFRKRQVNEFDNKGIKSYLAHNYFNLGLPDLKNNPDRATAKRNSADPAGSGGYNFWIGNGSLRENNLIPIAIYLNAPDLEIGILYDAVYKMINSAAIGQSSAIFLEENHEWRPNNLVQIKYPEGIYYQYEGIPLDPNVAIGSSFLSHVFGKGIVQWGAQGKKTDNRKLATNYRDGLWFAIGSSTYSGEFSKGKWISHGGPAFPYSTTGNDYWSPYMAGIDLVAFGSKMYAETFGKTYGGATQYLRFRLDGGEWVTPSQKNADEITDAWYDKRGFAYAQVKDGKTAWFYMNAFADNLSHRLELILPSGQTVIETVSSSSIHAKLQ